MGSMSDLERLSIQLSYWIKHNLEHAQEFRDWAVRAEASGFAEVALKLEGAARETEHLNRHLEGALDLISNSGELKR